MPILSYRDLEVWRSTRRLIVDVYAVTKSLPETERFGRLTQIRRAAVSIAANIAEGSRRGGRREYRQFLLYAFGSGAELETYLIMCRDLDYDLQRELESIERRLTSIMRMLNRMVLNLPFVEAPNNRHPPQPTHHSPQSIRF